MKHPRCPCDAKLPARSAAENYKKEPMRRASTPLSPVLCSLRLSLQVQDAIDVIPTGGILEYASPVQRSMTKSGGISGTKLLGIYAKQDDIYEPGEQNTYRLPPIPTQKGPPPLGSSPFCYHGALTSPAPRSVLSIPYFPLPERKSSGPSQRDGGGYPAQTLPREPVPFLSGPRRCGR